MAYQTVNCPHCGTPNRVPGVNVSVQCENKDCKKRFSIDSDGKVKK